MFYQNPAAENPTNVSAFSQTFYTSEENQDWYKQKQLARQDALPIEKVDRLLELQESALINPVALLPPAPSEAISDKRDDLPKPGRISLIE